MTEFERDAPWWGSIISGFTKIPTPSRSQHDQRHHSDRVHGLHGQPELAHNLKCVESNPPPDWYRETKSDIRMKT